MRLSLDGGGAAKGGGKKGGKKLSAAAKKAAKNAAKNARKKAKKASGGAAPEFPSDDWEVPPLSAAPPAPVAGAGAKVSGAGRTWQTLLATSSDSF